MLQNFGTITFSSADVGGTEAFNGIHFGAIFGGPEAGPGVINNAGIFNVTAGGDFSRVTNNVGSAINNSGTWNVSGAGVTSKVSEVAFNNSNTVNITNGTLTLAGGGTSTGSFSVSGGAALTFSDGTHHLNAGSVVSGAGFVEVTNAISTGSGFTEVNVAGTFTTPLRVSGGTVNFQAVATPPTISFSNGTLSGAGLVSATGNLTWTGGTMSGTGTTSVAGPASTIHDTSIFSGEVILGRVLTNTGTIVFDADDTGNGINFGADAVTPGVLNNGVGGTFNVTAGGDFEVNQIFFNASHAINNRGIWNVSGAGTTSTVESGIIFNNSGNVAVQSGTLALRGGDGGNTTGDFAVTAGADLLVESNFSFASGANLTGAGSVTFADGISKLYGGGHTIAEVNVTGGVLDIRASQTFNDLNISDGAIVRLTSIGPAFAGFDDSGLDTINGDALLDAAFIGQGALLASESAVGVKSVPEPSSAVLLALAGCWLLNLRRKGSERATGKP